MSPISELREWYSGLSDVERHKVKITVVGIIVLIIALYMISNSIIQLSSFFKGGVPEFNMTDLT